MDARTPVEPEADSARAYFEETRERPRRASMVKLGLLLSVVVALVAAVAIWPQPVRDLAEKGVAFVQGMMPGKSEPKEEGGETAAKKAANSGERVFRPTKEQRTALEIKPVTAVTFRPEYSAEAASRSTKTTTCPSRRPIRAA